MKATVDTTILITTVIILITAQSHTQTTCPDGCSGCDTGVVTCDIQNQVWSQIKYISNAKEITSLTVKCITDANGVGSLTSLDGLSEYSELLSFSVAGCSGVNTIRGNTFRNQGKLETLDLSRNGINKINKDSFEGLNDALLIDLGGNRIEDIPSGVFSRLTKLQELVLYNNKLDRITKEHFAGLIALNKLNLGNNELTSVPINIFKNTLALNEINLSNNDLTVLEKDLFKDLSNLQMVDVSGNKLPDVQTGTFSGASLKSVNLGNNDLHAIRSDMFNYNLLVLDVSGNFLQTIPADMIPIMENADSLHFHNNIFHCNCELLAFRDFFMQNIHKFHSLYFPKCVTPMDGYFDQVKRVEYTCTEPIIQPIIGDNMGMICKAYGEPAPNVSWSAYNRDINKYVILSNTTASTNMSQTTTTVKLPKYNIDESAMYYCVATNRIGETNVSTYAYVHGSSTGSDDNLVSVNVVIGAVVGTFVVTACVMGYVLMCVNLSPYLKCCKSGSPAHKSQASRHKHRNETDENIYETVTGKAGSSSVNNNIVDMDSVDVNRANAYKLRQNAGGGIDDDVRNWWNEMCDKDNKNKRPKLSQDLFKPAGPDILENSPPRDATHNQSMESLTLDHIDVDIPPRYKKKSSKSGSSSRSSASSSANNIESGIDNDLPSSSLDSAPFEAPRISGFGVADLDADAGSVINRGPDQPISDSFTILNPIHNTEVIDEYLMNRGSIKDIPQRPQRKPRKKNTAPTPYIGNQSPDGLPHFNRPKSADLKLRGIMIVDGSSTKYEENEADA